MDIMLAKFLPTWRNMRTREAHVAKQIEEAFLK
jgi:hypothetical protein